MPRERLAAVPPVAVRQSTLAGASASIFGRVTAFPNRFASTHASQIIGAVFCYFQHEPCGQADHDGKRN